MNTYSFLASEKQIEEILACFNKQDISYNINYIAYQIKTNKVVISIYKSNKVVISGKESDYYYHKFNFSDSFIQQAGSDEVGLGDYFGPITVAATYIDEKTYEKLKEYKFDDSKKLTDEYILDVIPKVISFVPYSLQILNNEKYNEIYASNNNNAIKAKMHNQAYLNLIKKGVKLPSLIVIDQFCSEKNYYNYLIDQKEVIKGITFQTKAESQYLAVGLASMIARYAFLIEMDKMSQKYQMIFPKGASEIVDEFAKEFIKKYGVNELKNVAKINYKNTERII